MPAAGEAAGRGDRIPGRAPGMVRFRLAEQVPGEWAPRRPARGAGLKSRRAQRDPSRLSGARACRGGSHGDRTRAKNETQRTAPARPAEEPSGGSRSTPPPAVGAERKAGCRKQTPVFWPPVWAPILPPSCRPAPWPGAPWSALRPGADGLRGAHRSRTARRRACAEATVSSHSRDSAFRECGPSNVIFGQMGAEHYAGIP